MAEDQINDDLQADPSDAETQTVRAPVKDVAVQYDVTDFSFGKSSSKALIGRQNTSVKGEFLKVRD
eukprot:m.244736 g.244736  ORF g.244736 m.244736 type:complete len:66 (+) comp40247_c1_seq64:397-594(+)